MLAYSQKVTLREIARVILTNTPHLIAFSNSYYKFYWFNKDGVVNLFIYIYITNQLF